LKSDQNGIESELLTLTLNPPVIQVEIRPKWD